MRSDMVKVIVERPRHMSGLRYRYNRRKAQKQNLSKEPMQLRGRRLQKDLSENLSPLRRYLESQLGRPWAKVYSEVSKTVPKNSTILIHLHFHLRQMVEQNVTMIDRVPYGPPHHGSTLPIRDGDYYVHPKSGLLLKWKYKKRYHYSRPSNPHLIPISDLEELVFKKTHPRSGLNEPMMVWFHRTYEMVEERIWDSDTQSYRQKEFKHLRSEKQLSTKELEKRGLENRAFDPEVDGR